jgi:hypothetical protein
MKPLEPIRAELTGDDTATAEGLIAKTNSGPVFALCRKLMGAGFDARQPLHCYRGETLCLTVTSRGSQVYRGRCAGGQTQPSPLQAVFSGGGGAAHSPE